MHTRCTSHLTLTAALAVALMLAGCTTTPTPSPSTAPPTPSVATNTATPAAPAPPPSTTVAPNPVLTTDPPVDGTMNDLVPPDLPALPLTPITVNTEGAGPSGIQKLADDIAAGNVEAIVANCWTQPADEVRQVYGNAAIRDAVLQALKQTPVVAQGGVFWNGQYVHINALWQEYNSNYSCPDILWGDTSGATCTWTGLGTFTPTMAAWRINRILAVRDGSPVHTGDGTGYWLVCNADCAMWNPHSTEQIYDAVPPIMNATDAQWDRLRQLSKGPIIVEHIASGYFRVRAADGSTDAVAYFTADYTDYWVPYVLGEIA